VEDKAKELEKEIQTLKGTVLVLQSQISTLSGDVDLKVNKDEVIDAINTSSEGDRIKGNKIHIDKDTLIDNEVIAPVHLD